MLQYKFGSFESEIGISIFIKYFSKLWYVLKRFMKKTG